MQQIEDWLEKRGLGQYARRMSKIDQSISIRDTDDLPELLSPIADITKNSFPNAKFSRSLFDASPEYRCEVLLGVIWLWRRHRS
jgi:hypothetical protein